MQYKGKDCTTAFQRWTHILRSPLAVMSLSCARKRGSRSNQMIRFLALLIILLLAAQPAWAGLSVVKSNGITLTGADGIDYVGINGITLTGADGIFNYSSNGITLP